MSGILYEEASIAAFLILTVIFGGGAAWQTGRATAQTWRPLGTMILYSIGITIVVRFLHFAVFGGTLLSAHYFLVDLAVVAAAMFAGYQAQRAEQMATQYSWLFERSGPFGWSAKKSG
jgi:hypothetical protein